MENNNGRNLGDSARKRQMTGMIGRADTSEGAVNTNTNSGSPLNKSSQKRATNKCANLVNKRQRQGSAPNQNSSNLGVNTVSSEGQLPKKKRVWLRVVAGVTAILVLGIGGLAIYKKATYKPPVYIVTPQYESTGRYILDTYKGSLITYDIDNIKAYTAGDSWLAKEWDYANQIEVRQNFIKSVCAYVDFSYPQVQAKLSNGSLAVDSQGQAVMQDADMFNGETFTVTYIDYDSLAATMREDIVLIASMYEQSGYCPEDYTYRDDMVNLMLNYILDKPNLPTKTVEITLPLEKTQITVTGADGSSALETAYVISDDSVLDTLLFGSDAFHNMCDVFGTIIYQYDNKALVGVNAPEKSAFDEDVQLLDTSSLIAEAENSESAESAVTSIESSESSVLDTSTVEDTSSILDAVTSLNDNLSSSSDESLDSGLSSESVDADSSVTDIEDDENADIEEKPHNEEGYVYESVIPYTWIGAYYLANDYTGDLNPVAQEGDGSFDMPAAVDTSIVTSVLCEDGEFHDVRVTMRGMWVGQDAIDYAIGYSEKNRGFDNSSAVKLVCFEVEVENLENVPIVAQSELYLADAKSNPSARTGRVYGFTDSAEIQPSESVILQDWATSTELYTKYVCWGKDFSRKFPTVWFKLLAGSGDDTADYNANEVYTHRDDEVSSSSVAEIYGEEVVKMP